MRGVTFWILLLFPLATLPAAPAAENDAPDAEPLRSGIFTYRIFGDRETGTETLWFDSGKSCRLRKTEIAPDGEGTALPVERLDIEDGEWIYVIDLVRKTGYKVPHPDRAFSRMEESEKKETRDRFIGQTLDSLAPVLEQTRSPRSETVEFFGKPCRMVRGPFFKTLVWKNVILRQEVSIPYRKVREITDMKINVPVPASRFEPPDDIEIARFDQGELRSILGALEQLQNRVQNQGEDAR
jgi:hypothetical protein